MADRSRWYGGLSSWKGPRGRAQVGMALGRADSIDLPEPVLRLAQAEYDLQFPGQPYEQMQRRGGLSVLEIIGLLADALERERADG